jgi:hypothetical protein
MAYKRPIPCKNPPATLNRKLPQFFPRLNIRLRPSRFPGVIAAISNELCNLPVQSNYFLTKTYIFGALSMTWRIN